MLLNELEFDADCYGIKIKNDMYSEMFDVDGAVVMM